MPVIFLYLFKLSLSLAVVYFFYHFVLRRLTFYNWNRFYLLVYTALSFVIPVINITPMLERNEMMTSRAVQFIPSFSTMDGIENPVVLPQNNSISLSVWDWSLMIVTAGVVIMSARLVVQLLSFRKIIKKAKLVSDEDVKLYQVDQVVIPFSFGNSIFMNQHQHSETELQEIIRHEFVHIKQKHTIDILWSEMLCIINWYNPIVWLIRKSIRQNLEFIADNKVLQSGIDKTKYQYLLLKVTGNNYFSIASQFNFSSLKKRIAMMNKMKSADTHIIKFLFMLPLISILLIAFRNNDKNPELKKEGYGLTVIEKAPAKILSDTLPGDTKPYIIEVIINSKRNDTTIVVRDRNKKEVKRMEIGEWNKKKSYYENLYGQILVGTVVNANQKINDASAANLSTSPGHSLFKYDNQPLVVLDGVEQPENTDPASLLQPSEIFEMTVWQAEDAISKYGYKAKNGVIAITSRAYAGRTIEETASTTVNAATSVSPVMTTTSNIGTVMERPIETTVSGITTKEIAGKPVEVSSKGFGTIEQVSTVKPVQTTVSAKSPTSVTESKVSSEPAMAVKEVRAINKTIAVIKSTTSEVDLRKLESSLKSKGYNLKINKAEYKDGTLISISGTINRINSEGGQAFVASDFSKMIITEAPDEDNNLFNFLVPSGNLRVINAN